MSRVLIISLSDLARDPRVDRQIGFLKSTHEVVAAGLAPPDYPDVEFVDLVTSPRNMVGEGFRQAGSVLRLLAHRYEDVYWRHPFNRVALKRLATHRADVVIANDLSSLPLACRVAGSAPVIFDAHEFAAEEHADRTWWRLLMAPYVDALTRRYLPQTAAMMTVGQGIANVYAERYGADPVVVTNAPPGADLQPAPMGRRVRLIHHGGAQPERRLELMIEALDLLDDRFELDLMLMPTSPSYIARLHRLACERDRVRIVDAVSQRQIVAAINAYDVGIFVLPPRSLNQRFVLPNKLFEFIQARLAVVIGPSPEMAEIVNGYSCGVVTRDFSSASLAEALSSLTVESIERYKEQSDRAAAVLNAERNREVVVTLVDRVLSSGSLAGGRDH
jgi:glycosyltransferase involved in cell wall biosynthesis